MVNFEPSEHFVARIMSEVRKYEVEANSRPEGVNSFLLSRPVFTAVSAGGILLGIFNVIRMALILISPAVCF